MMAFRSVRTEIREICLFWVEPPLICHPSSIPNDRPYYSSGKASEEQEKKIGKSEKKTPKREEEEKACCWQRVCRMKIKKEKPYMKSSLS